MGIAELPRGRCGRRAHRCSGCVPHHSRQARTSEFVRGCGKNEASARVGQPSSETPSIVSFASPGTAWERGKNALQALHGNSPETPKNPITGTLQSPIAYHLHAFVNSFRSGCHLFMYCNCPSAGGQTRSLPTAARSACTVRAHSIPK